MKHILLSICMLLCANATLQAQNFEQEARDFQKELNEAYKDKEKSPLSKKARRKFKKHHFFPINQKFRVEAKLKLTPNAKPFQMATSTDRLPSYKKYADAIFEIDGKTYTLELYQNLKLIEQEKYRNSLFLPFTDLTSGEETYGGGRYIDVEIPTEGNVLVIDFNQAYYPYCAYSYNYSCPIPPQANFLNVKIEAGIREEI